MITNYIGEDTLHNWMCYNKNFGNFFYYKQKGNMIVETVKPSPAFPGAKSSIVNIRRYWKFVKVKKGVWNAYEVNEKGEQIREPFELTE